MKLFKGQKTERIWKFLENSKSKYPTVALVVAIVCYFLNCYPNIKKLFLFGALERYQVLKIKHQKYLQHIYQKMNNLNILNKRMTLPPTPCPRQKLQKSKNLAENVQ